MTEPPNDIGPTEQPVPAAPSTVATIFKILLGLVLFFMVAVGLVVMSWFSSIQGHPL